MSENITYVSASKDMPSSHEGVLQKVFYHHDDHRSLRLTVSYVLVVLMVLGILGNILSFTVWLRKKLRRSRLAKHMCLLALADIMTLVSGFLVRVLPTIWDVDLTVLHSVFCRGLHALLGFSSCVSALTVVTMTIERFIVVSDPLKSATCLTKVKLPYSMALIILVSGGVNSLSIFGNSWDETEKRCDAWQPFADYITLAILTLYSPIPAVIILLLNVAIITKMGRFQNSIRRDLESQVSNKNSTKSQVSSKNSTKSQVSNKNSTKSQVSKKISPTSTGRRCSDLSISAIIGNGHHQHTPTLKSGQLSSCNWHEKTNQRNVLSIRLKRINDYARTSDSVGKINQELKHFNTRSTVSNLHATNTTTNTTCFSRKMQSTSLNSKTKGDVQSEPTRTSTFRTEKPDQITIKTDPNSNSVVKPSDLKKRELLTKRQNSLVSILEKIYSNPDRKVQQTPPNNRRLTIMLLTVTFSYFILTTPYTLCIYLLLGLSIRDDKDAKTAEMLENVYTAQHFLELSLCLNHSINILLYCASGSKFREEFKRMFTFHNKYKMNSSTRSMDM